MNTEAINTLKQLREVINQNQVLLNDESLKKGERKLLEQVLSNLYELEDTIITQSLQAMAVKLNSSNADLKKLINQMQESSDKIQKFSDTIKKISGIISILTEITSKAIKAGIA